MIVAEVAGLQENELQTMTQKLEELKKENEELKQMNEALKLANQQLTTQLDEKNQLLVIKDEEAEQLQREFDDCKARRVHAERQLAEFFELDSVSILCFLEISD